MNTVRNKPEDYLRELISGDGSWRDKLVELVLAVRRCPSKAQLDQVFGLFMAEHHVPGYDRKVPVIPAVSEGPTTRTSFSLTELKDVKGVNALKDGANLNFHPKLTVIYGRNGSGKSGFVRILKRLAGSKTQEEIWQNLRKGRSKNRCEACVVYAATKPMSFDWKGESLVSPFRDMGIFDGKSVSVHLTKSLEFSYQPIGFELFEALSDAYRGLSERLVAETRRKEVELPQLDFGTSGTRVAKFLAGVNDRTSAEQLADASKWNDALEASLEQLIKEKAGLQNLGGQREVLVTRRRKLEAVDTILDNIETELSATTLRSYSQLAKKVAKLRSRKTEKQGKTLEDYKIPESESSEWDSFLSAGEDYIAVSEGDEYPTEGERCVYCQQKLTKGSAKLLKLYRELFAAEETSELDEVETKISYGVHDLQNVAFLESVPYDREEFEEIIPKATVAKVFGALQTADLVAARVVEMLETAKAEDLDGVDVKPLRRTLATKVAALKAEEARLKEAQRNIQKREVELDLQIAELQNQKKLSKSRDVVTKHIETKKWLARARGLPNLLNTKSVTDLSKRAWDELVSEGFKATFEKECQALNAPSVTLAFRGDHGGQRRDKSFEGLVEIEEVLSEGEQKAVALADFLADQSMQAEVAPVVFDDPANSFDHERKAVIAARIVRESEKRQVVVFTHDLMFASYLHGNIQTEKGEIDKARAAFHDVRSEGRNAGLITENYYPGAINFDAQMKKVDQFVAEASGQSGEKLADSIANAYSHLRRAVEKAVEERIFGKVINRWTDQIQLNNVSRASLDAEKLRKAKEYHERFSAYIDAHNQSNEMIQHSMPSLTQLKSDITLVADIALRPKG